MSASVGVGVASTDAEIFYGIDCRFGWFDADTCDKMLQIAGSFPDENDAFSYGALGARTSKTYAVAQSAASDWLYELVWQRAVSSNKRFNFQLDSLESPLQIIRYRPTERVDWHIDCGGDLCSGGRRKLSVSVQLSESDAYQGGDLEFLGRPLHPFARERGSIITFPSFLAHRVTPVTTGFRYSLVAFVEGVPFA